MRVDACTKSVCHCQGYRHNHGFCAPGDEKFFETGEGRNYTTQVLYWTTVKYGESTGTCTFTKTRYKCANYLSPYCWTWDTTGVEDNKDVEQTPQYNREKNLLGNDI